MGETVSDGISGSAFAELLRELKNRSGHSYGTLAKRLHMSTSTLHRYCNGDAVPADYAPVERLARLCRATPEELVELHRRWVLADAGRGRKEPRAVPQAQTQTPAQAQAPTAAVKAETAAAAAAEAAAVAEEGVREPVAEPDPAPVAVPVRPRRRRRLLLSALTVTALLAGVAVALNLPADDGKQDGRGATATVESAARAGAPPTPTTGSPTPRRSATRSASPSPSPSSSGRSPATRTGTPESRPDTAATGGGATAAAPPLTVTTHPFSWQSPCSQHYLIDRPPAAVYPPPLEQDAPAWVDVHQAVSAGEQYVTFTVQGTGSRTVVLEKLSVRMAGRRAPLAWNDYAMGYPGVGCGGGVPTRSFTVALDAMRPAPVPEAGSRDFPFKVSQSDPEVFHVTADASAYDVSWYLELSWSSGDRHGTLVVDDGGRPFRTSGSNGRPAYAFPLGGQKWRPASEAE
ncbi:helix-turn-helix domain-containing protein [Streptomyces sp. Go40/10]|uniref:helix-turn-helix domain-containing protein n=1 Tax=Streptomyces sp. Go40/10 TaxID=2825844 RepID=UPI001E484427|nr:helix-turn-helix transcriptional regulator [Streptomyces sp. Go40/10]UFR03044.1 helix-turn-helix domain-containing protein [Streptomyces sp. Go40/10]